MTKKIQYRDDPSSVQWKDITAADVGAAAEDVSEGIIISTATPSIDPGNNKIYIQDKADNHNIYVKNVYDRVIRGPFQFSTEYELEQLANQEWGIRTDLCEKYQGDYRKCDKIEGRVRYPIRYDPFSEKHEVIDINFSFNLSNFTLSMTYINPDPPYDTITVSTPISSITGNNSYYTIRNPHTSEAIKLENGYDLRISPRTPIFRICSCVTAPYENPDSWTYGFFLDPKKDYYFITHNADNKYDLLDYKDFGLSTSKTTDLTTVTGAIVSVNSKVQITQAKLHQWGRVSQLQLSFKPINSIDSTAIKLATISPAKVPKEFRPISIINGGNVTWTAHYNSAGDIWVKNLGSTVTGSTTTPGNSIDMGFTFIGNPNEYTG